MTLLLPAASMVVVLITTAWSLRGLGAELALLRRSLRQAGATAVALDELDRDSVIMTERVVSMRSDAAARLHRPRHPSLAR